MVRSRLSQDQFVLTMIFKVQARRTRFTYRIFQFWVLFRLIFGPPYCICNTCYNGWKTRLFRLEVSNYREVVCSLLYRGPYRWLFLIEGGLTCLIASAGAYMIPDFPTTPVSWLTHEEQLLAQRRMVEDFGSIKQQGTQKSGLVEAFTDWTVWWLVIARSMAAVGESFVNFFPTLAATIGYGPSITLLICAPPWIFAMATAYYVSQFVRRLIPFLNSSLKPFSDTQTLPGTVSGTSLLYYVLVSWVLPSGF